jgi:hypothetical protein
VIFQESEVIRLLLGIAAAVILALSRSGLRRLSGYRIFSAAYFILLAGWIFTVVEHAFFPDIFNILEHAAYLISGALYAVWSFRLVKGGAK